VTDAQLDALGEGVGEIIGRVPSVPGRCQRAIVFRTARMRDLQAATPAK
jgi:hypothetical protein